MNETMDVPQEAMSEEEAAAKREREEALAARVEALGNSLAKTRDEAVKGRAASGIEQEWNEVEEAYQGIDEANRGSVMVGGKPSSPNGGYTNGPVAAAGRSTVFMNITRPYVDAASARVGDMMLPTDDTCWSLKPTKIPSTLPMELQPPAPAAEAAPMVSPAMAGATGLMAEAGAPAAPAQPPVMNEMAQAIAKAKQSAEKATEQIEDWLVECQWHAEVRKMIEDCARLGTGILKGPFPEVRTSMVSVTQDGQPKLVIQKEVKPASRAISPWKFYPDPGCGENIHDGSYTWELDSITTRSLRDLKLAPGYLSSQIDKVLAEGPSGKHQEAGIQYQRVTPDDDNNYEIWYFYGDAKREDLIAAGVKLPEGEDDVTVPAIITMVNNTVIKAALSPMDLGGFPYDVMPWQRRTGLPWGTGIGKQISTPQRMLNAATRNMMDNSGLSAGPQMVLRQGTIVPADGKYQLTPRKFWWLKEGADVTDINQAIAAINIPTMQVELSNIIQFALKMAEDLTGMPMIMQGQATGNTPDTVGGMQLVNNNASAVLRRIARLFDDKVTEPHIRRYYQWLMEVSDNDEAKGDFQIDARGSTALVERDIQNQAIVQMGQLVMNPAFGVDPAKWFAEYLKSLRLDPKRFELDEAQKAAMAQQQQPQAPAVQAAQIRSETELKKTEMTLKAQVEKVRVDTDRDTVYVQAQTARDQANHAAKMAELALRRELALLDYANSKELSLETVKAQLAQTAMKLNATKELAAMEAGANRLPTPPVEPPGIAEDGHSFTQ